MRVRVDDRDNVNPGFKFAEAELNGVPLRVELGPRDLESKSVMIVRRDNNAKQPCSWDKLVSTIQELCTTIQTDLLAKAREQRAQYESRAHNWTEFMAALAKGHTILTPWCNTVESEIRVKKRSGEECASAEEGLSSGAKTLCIPFDQPELPAGTKCFESGEEAKCWVMWGRSY